MILEKFGWTWDYLLWGVRYPIVQKMMADAPWTDFKTEESGKKGKPKTNTKSFAEYVKNIPR